jgi:hypothetical protein
MHGLATLWLTGNLADPDPESLARAVGSYLFMTGGASNTPAPPGRR